MEKINFLFIEDDQDQFDLVKSVIDEINEDKKEQLQLSYKVVCNSNDAKIALYEESFQAIILDLNLDASDNGVIDDEKLSGNILLNQIIKKEIIPIVVRTGSPDKISNYIDKNIIKVCGKDTSVYDIINELIQLYSDPIYKLFGSTGKINENVKELFWQVIPNCLSNKHHEIESLNQNQKEIVLIRYISSWVANKYSFDKQYLNVEPIEMYMFPNPIEQICTGDIFKDNNTQLLYIVLTPSCDLANKKVESILLCRIVSYKENTSFWNNFEQYQKNSNKKENLLKWFRNSTLESMRYHFLPKVSFFDGGFIDFRSITMIEFDNEQDKLKNDNFKKLGVITENFKRDIIARFSAYYHRQGQPEFNSISVLTNLQKISG